ncbi:MAG TPA: hypothetical protein VLZ56_08905 [Mycoplana sp.]|nr:hypothetical protein [Mycoplana sp.]
MPNLARGYRQFNRVCRIACIFWRIMYRSGCGAIKSAGEVSAFPAWVHRSLLNDLANGEVMAQNGNRLEVWACNKAQEIVLREGFDLIRSARTGSSIEIRQHSLTLAKAIAASLLEASAATDKHFTSAGE